MGYDEPGVSSATGSAQGSVTFVLDVHSGVLYRSYGMIEGSHAGQQMVRLDILAGRLGKLEL
jgi:hypothetical protein